MSKDGALPDQPAGAAEPLLKVTGLVKHFPIKEGLLKRQTGAVQAVDGLDFDVRAGETLGVVGESGCGKSTMGRLITRLLEPTSGKIEFQGTDITHLGTSGMRPLRRDVQMIFQDPYSSLNPRHTVGTIVSAPFRLQGVTPEGGVKAEVQRLLSLVGLNPEHYNRYPHEFSGGQRQRIGIARALALKPKLVVADEPVSALDVSIQAQVVNLLDDLQEEMGLTYVIIAHDLSVIRHVSDRIAVMYLGKIVELADRDSLYRNPRHPYTKALLSAVPIPDPKRRGKQERILLKGDVPSPISPPTGCRFHTRCWKATELCKTEQPALLTLTTGHQVACHHPEPEDAPAADSAVVISPKAEAPAGDANAPAGDEAPAEAPEAAAPADAAEADAPAADEAEGKASAEAAPKADAESGTESEPEADSEAGAPADDEAAEDGEAADKPAESAEKGDKAGKGKKAAEPDEAEEADKTVKADENVKADKTAKAAKTDKAAKAPEAGKAEEQTDDK
ncbi:dipeptide ABC transporter ATP-binding protein [Streptomyces palmae]|uniref:dipeptide ABC transporter ATP-binding protein n=1 Tax=Streptomyces palmae TaxID=1701085 RepID=UPI001432D042|nr:dipeptide ABC transporter ATP-binding protein [Streptomyces palmae]